MVDCPDKLPGAREKGSGDEMLFLRSIHSGAIDHLKTDI